ncbi:protein draper-like [Saccostrea cucullata]|uniref:protein draper-like n=1 Tax=Saccostrea cuccullata TaxID=36930 RepID=UPI002ED0D6FF
MPLDSLENGTVASLSSTYSVSYNASNVLDDKPDKLKFIEGSCSRTDVKEYSAWLRIDLGNNYNIQLVKFWYRNDSTVSTSSLQGYYIRVTSSSEYGMNSWNEGQICYQDLGNETLPLPVLNEQECHRTGRYVWIVNNNASEEDYPYVHLEICEVEIYGCNENEYGENCTDCGPYCNLCDILQGCTDCSENHNGSSCEDCLPGYRGINCSEKCPEGFYGSNCSENCTGICNENQTCNHVTGKCECRPGFFGQSCTERCLKNTYGQDCIYNCSQNCQNGEACDYINGSCTDGCIPGWRGELCNESM